MEPPPQQPQPGLSTGAAASTALLVPAVTKRGRNLVISHGAKRMAAIRMAFQLHVRESGGAPSWAPADACSEDPAKVYAYWTRFATIKSFADKSELNRHLNIYIGMLFSSRAGCLRYGIMSVPGGGFDWVYTHLLRAAVDELTIPYLKADCPANATWWPSFGFDETDARKNLLTSISDMFKVFANSCDSPHGTIDARVHLDKLQHPLPRAQWAKLPPAATQPQLDAPTASNGSTGLPGAHAAGGGMQLGNAQVEKAAAALRLITEKSAGIVEKNVASTVNKYASTSGPLDHFCPKFAVDMAQITKAENKKPTNPQRKAALLAKLTSLGPDPQAAALQYIMDWQPSLAITTSVAPPTGPHAMIAPAAAAPAAPFGVFAPALAPVILC